MLMVVALLGGMGCSGPSSTDSAGTDSTAPALAEFPDDGHYSFSQTDLVNGSPFAADPIEGPEFEADVCAGSTSQGPAIVLGEVWLLRQADGSFAAASPTTGDYECAEATDVLSADSVRADSLVLVEVQTLSSPSSSSATDPDCAGVDESEYPMQVTITWSAIRVGDYEEADDPNWCEGA